MSLASLKIWIDAARPKTLSAGIAPVLIGSVMAYAEGSFQIFVFMATLFAAVMIQIGTNYANDYYDYAKGADTEKRLGPVRATQAGLVSPMAMKRAFVVAFGLAVAAGFYLVFKGGFVILLIGLISIVCGILYTAGPLALGYLGLADLFVLIFFGPIAVAGTYYLQIREIHSYVIIAGLSPGLLSTALLVVNNVRDYTTDKEGGKKTLVVRFGVFFGIVEYYVCIIIASLIPLMLSLMTRSHLYCNLAMITLLFAWGPMRSLSHRPGPETLNCLLSRTGKLVFIYSVLFSVGWIL
jgi:1,4-dihydroxy-2-naphthoate octaprenyltransferase